MVDVAEKTLKEVDVILWLVEPSNFIGAGERHIAEILEKVNAPVILIINKTDTVEKDKILEFIDTYRKLFQFAEIIPCSALRHQNTDDIIPASSNICRTARSSTMRTPSPISRCARSWLRSSARKHCTP